MTDFREPLGIPQSGEPPTPRVGIAPFGEGEITPVKSGGFERIESRRIPAGGLGNVYIRLERPLGEGAIEIDPMRYPGGATVIGASGNVSYGNSTDFVRKGYYAVNILIDHPDNTPPYHDRFMKTNLWIDGLDRTFQAEVINPKAATNQSKAEQPRWHIIENQEDLWGGYLFLDQAAIELLPRIRVSFEGKMQPPKGVTR